MDELTMLVQLAGGELDAASRLRAAGLHRAKDIAEATVDDICVKGGLSPAAARRLQHAANESVEVTPVRKAGTLGRGLTGLPTIGPGSAELAGVPHTRSLEGTKTSHKKVEDEESTDRGVSHEESSALAGTQPREERSVRSFWRFG